MHKIFISYSRSDYAQVMKLKDEIEKVVGKGSCWIDVTGIESDRQFVDVIIDAIDKADVFLFMYSKHSDQSEWTRKEIEYAYSEKKRIVFVKMSDVQLSKYFRFQFGGHNIIDINVGVQKRHLMDNLAEWCGISSNSSQQDFADLHSINHHLNEKQGGAATAWGTKVANYLPEVLLSLSLFILPLGLVLFIAVNYLYRKQLQSRYPNYWKIVLSLSGNIHRILLGINLIMAFLLVCFSIQQGYDEGLFSFTCLLLFLNIVLLLCGVFRPAMLGLKRKKEVSVGLGLPTMLYLLPLFFVSMPYEQDGVGAAPIEHPLPSYDFLGDSLVVNDSVAEIALPIEEADTVMLDWDSVAYKE